jgi:hypothetical protein
METILLTEVCLSLTPLIHSKNIGDKGSIYQMLGETQNAGITSTDGQLWQDQRRFGLKFLRDFGLGKNQMQDRVIIILGVFK